MCPRPGCHELFFQQEPAFRIGFRRRFGCNKQRYGQKWVLAVIIDQQFRQRDELDLCQRMVIAELQKPLCDQIGNWIGLHNNSSPKLPIVVPKLMGDLLPVRKRLLCVFQKSRSRLCQNKFFRQPIEQANRKLFFQLPNGLAKSRLRNMQFFRGSCDVSFRSNCNKIFHL